jgi:hypothetical protein
VDLKYSVNGHIMGSTLNRPERFDFRVEIQTPPNDRGQRVRRIQVLHNHPSNLDQVEVAAEALFDGEQARIEWTTTIEDDSSRYFFLRISRKRFDCGQAQRARLDLYGPGVDRQVSFTALRRLRPVPR